MPKVDICALDEECIQKSQHYIEHWCLPPHQKQRNKPCFRSSIFFLTNILPVFHSLYMFLIVLFRLCPHELLRVWNFNTFLHKCSFVHDCAFSSLLFLLHVFASPSSLIVFLPLSAPLWLPIFSTTLLWIVVFLSQKCSPPLCPYALYVPPQIVAPQLRLLPILQCTLDLLM
jgi:hypothetical protein